MTLIPDGIQAAADREDEFHPRRLRLSTPISAWQRRAATLTALVAEVNRLSAESAETEALLRSVDWKLDELLGRPW